MTQPEHIGAILARNQQAPFQTFEVRTCECGKEFRATIAAPFYQTKCPDCREKERVEQRVNEAKSRLSASVEITLDEWWEKVNMPGKFCDKTFSNFDKKLQPKALDAVKNLDWKNNKSLVLSSPALYGVGKTHLVCALINEIFESEEKARVTPDGQIFTEPCPVYFTSENELLLRIRKTYNRQGDESGETEDKIYNKLARFTLLIIDDVGKVRPKDLTFLQGVYFNIIDQRYTAEQPVILTTNLEYPDLEEHIGGACADRLREMCGKNFIKMSGKSYRRNDVPTKS